MLLSGRETVVVEVHVLVYPEGTTSLRHAPVMPPDDHTVPSCDISFAYFVQPGGHRRELKEDSKQLYADFDPEVSKSTVMPQVCVKNRQTPQKLSMCNMIYPKIHKINEPICTNLGPSRKCHSYGRLKINLFILESSMEEEHSVMPFTSNYFVYRTR